MLLLRCFGVIPEIIRQLTYNQYHANFNTWDVISLLTPLLSVLF